MPNAVFLSVSRIRAPGIAAVILVLLGLAGCSHYQVGKPADTPFQTIYIEPVANRSFAPQAQALLSTQVREHLMRDGRVQVVGPNDADAILRITLEDYDREASAVRGDDTVLASKFNMRLVATCTLIDARTGRHYFRDRSTETDIDAFIGFERELVDPDDPFPPPQGLQSEYQSMPVLTGKLSRQIGNMVLHTW